jgi:hypothetical protein
MIFLATTRQGYEAYRTLNTESALWISAAVLAADEVYRLRAGGLNVTTMAQVVRSNDPGALADAIASIQEHHPGEHIWVEG